MKVTIERGIGGELAQDLLAIHRMLFRELDQKAVQVQSLPDELFLELLAHPDVVEFVGWTDAGEPHALLVVTEDLTLVPWISAGSIKAMYPEHAADSRLFYVPCLQVHPESQGSPLTKGVIHALAHFLSDRDGVVAFDTCQWDVDNLALPHFISRWTAEIAPVDTVEIDVQRYYAYHVHPKVTIDLTEESDPGLVIDLREPTRDAHTTKAIHP